MTTEAVSDAASEAIKESRNDRRRRETRRKVLLAAVELFTERGFDAVTIDEIADRADVARGTVFNHFPTKENLCEGLAELQVELVEEAIADGRISGGPREKVTGVMRLLAGFQGRNPEHCRTVFTRALSCMKPGELSGPMRRVFELFNEWVEEGQRTGEFRQDVASSELACFLMGLRVQATITWAYGFVEGSLADHVTRVLELAMAGIRSRETGG
jgi:TetR/AcrR family transcriptional regulator, cholesterol catabolism regulator